MFHSFFGENTLKEKTLRSFSRFTTWASRADGGKKKRKEQRPRAARKDAKGTFVMWNVEEFDGNFFWTLLHTLKNKKGLNELEFFGMLLVWLNWDRVEFAMDNFAAQHGAWQSRA